MSFSFIMTDAEERYAPPEQVVLRVDVVGDRIFLDICEYDETNKEATLKTVASIAVNADPFVVGLKGAARQYDIDLANAQKRNTEEALAIQQQRPNVKAEPVEDYRVEYQPWSHTFAVVGKDTSERTFNTWKEAVEAAFELNQAEHVCGPECWDEPL
jgi:hypothetical protein